MASSFPVLSLIQGISEQSSFSRPQSSCLDQKNCINDLLRGARARAGTRVVSHFTANLDTAFFYRIERDAEQDYVVSVEGTSLRIFNLVDGVEATITYDTPIGDVGDYLEHLGETRQAFTAATVNDTTFLANREVIVAMGTEESLPRNNWGIAHFRSANYSTDYKLKVMVEGGSTYEVAHKTPDNSTAANADFIATNQLAEDFALALTTALPAGWGVYRKGSAILIAHDTLKFTVSSEDGLGGQQFIAFTNRAKQVADLPNSAWDDYIVAVGSKRSAGEADYYLKYVGGEQDGVWEEIVAPETKTHLDASTMPLHLVNTAKNAFTVGVAPWGARLAGDGVNSAQDPSYVGKTIKDLQFIDSRLAIVTTGSFTLSRSRNGYVFFPDTVQTTLATDPIDYTVANGKVTEISRAVVISKKLQLWANLVQSIVSGGQEALSEETTENPPVTSYEYDGRVAPITVGKSSLVFVTSNGNENYFLEVIFRNSEPMGEIEFNAHCPAIVPGTVRHLGAGGTAKMLFVLNEENPSTCFIYQWFNNGDERVQSAWNYWTMEGADAILWVGSTGSTVKMLVKHGDEVAIEVMELKPNTDEPGVTPLRADHRFDEVAASTTYDEGTITLELPWGLSEAQKETFVVYSRVDDEETGEQRGKVFPVTWVNSTTCTFRPDVENQRFWCGHIPVAEREPGRLYIANKDGTVLLDGLHIDSVRVQHKDTIHYEVEVIPSGDDTDPRTQDFWPGRIGEQVFNNKLAISKDGLSETIPVGLSSEDCRIVIRNPSIYPSSWEAMEYIYRAEKRYQN